jgi:hypothetical protein
MSMKENIVRGMIGLIGTIGAAMLTNWDKLFDSQPKNTSSPVKTKLLQVNADSIAGTRYQNIKNTGVQVQFYANSEDTWLTIPKKEENSKIPEDARGYLSADGALNVEPKTTLCPGLPLGALYSCEQN